MVDVVVLLVVVVVGAAVVGAIVVVVARFAWVVNAIEEREEEAEVALTRSPEALEVDEVDEPEEVDEVEDEAFPDEDESRIWYEMGISPTTRSTPRASKAATESPAYSVLPEFSRSVVRILYSSPSGQ
jgi:acyl-coenzyme A synthetase/AMP-(fatty) acid ligase